MPNDKQLKGGRAYFDSWFEGTQSIIMRRYGSWSVRLHSRKPRSHGGTQLAFSLYSAHILAHGMVLPIFSTDLLSSINPSWKPHRHTPSCVPVKPMVIISNILTQIYFIICIYYIVYNILYI